MELIQLTNHYPQHVVCAWMGNSEKVAEKHYLQITDDHLKAGCGMKPDRQVVAQVVADPSLIAPHAPSVKTQTLQKKAFPVIDHQGPSVGMPQMGDEGLERISYYSIKHEMLDKSTEQVVANTVANATLSETVALLIDGWDNMCPEERATLTALLWANTTNAPLQS